MLDIIIRQANLPDGQGPVDIAVQGDRIAEIAPRIDAEARDEIDATGRLVCPPFTDPHFHMDATLSLGLPRMNVSGTLLEGIALWGELKPLQSVDEIVERALRYCDLAVSMGIGAIRSHVDTCDDELKGVQALLEVRDKVKDYLDLQLVAFPQDGVLRDPTAMENTIRALDMGVDVVCRQAEAGEFSQDNAWLNQQSKLAAYQDGAWAFYDPQPGWRAWLQDQAQTEIFDGTDWLSDSPTDTSPVGAFTRLETVEEHLSLSGSSIQAANQIPDRAIVLGVSVRVDETITGASAFEVGLSAETDKFGGFLGINPGDTNIGVIGPQGFYTPTPIIVTAIGGDFTGGAIQLALHYIECGSPQPTT